MIDTRKVVLYISRRNIMLSRVINVPKVGDPDIQVVQFSWDGQNLTPLFQRLKKEYKGYYFHILVADEFSYILTLEVDQNNANREFIKSQLASLVPDTVEDGNFDWKIAQGSGKNGQLLIVNEVISHALLANFQQALKITLIEVSAMDTVGSVLAHVTADSKSPIIILWYSFESIGILSVEGNVYYTKKLSHDVVTDLQMMTDLAQTKYNLKVHNIIVDSSSPNNLPPFPQEYVVEKRSVNPFLIAHKMKKPVENDNNVLSLPLKPIQKTAKHPRRLFYEIGILAFIIILSIVIILLKSS